MVLLATFATLVSAQYDGPIPPRINIPGAIPIPNRVPQRERFLNAQPNQQPVIKVRKPARPIQIQQPIFQQQPRFIEPLEDKPVTEEPEDSDEFVPHIVSNPPQQIPVQAAPQRPAPQEVPSNAQRFNIERPKPTPQFRQLNRPQQFDDFDNVPARPIRPQQKQQPHHAPAQQAHHHNDKPKKPVAQILRKYREENEDGSITWGYENDDGSFKEEVIGIDCVTRGRYGYIDNDGNKREYSYETGNYCDPNKRDQEDEEDLDSYVNYDDRTAVLPNGVRVDLNQMGKHSKRPAYRN